jgi:hypothetical protein
MKEKGNIQLEDLDKKLPFTLPEGYFENFASTLPLQVGAKAKRVSFYHSARPYLFAAAIFVGVLLVSIPIYQKKQQAARIAVNEELKTYVVNEVDEETVVDYVADAELNK